MAVRKFSKALSRLTALNAVCLIALFAAEALVAERHWLTTLVTYIPQHLFGVPAMVLLIWSVRRGERRLAAVNALASVFFVSVLLGFNVPIRIRGAAASGPEVRVMTYNVHHGLEGVNRIVSDVRRIDPDIICLQEMNALGKKPSPLGPLSKALPQWHTASFGQLVVFSKWPIVESRLYAPSIKHMRMFLQVGVLVRGRRLNVVCVHLSTAAKPESLMAHRGSLSSYVGRTTQVRSLQIKDLLEITKGISGPLVVAGDFNTPPRGRLYRRMACSFSDCFRCAGWGCGYSFRSDLPVMRIDYIWAGSGLRPISCSSRAVAGSDHRPVVADMRFER